MQSTRSIGVARAVRHLRLCGGKSTQHFDGDGDVPDALAPDTASLSMSARPASGTIDGRYAAYKGRKDERARC